MNKRRRRRRRGGGSFLYRLICFVLIVGAVIAALTLFFRIESIRVSGNEKYREEEVLIASGLQKGNNLLLMNKYDVAQRIFDLLPYVEEAAIHREFPSTIVIELHECSPAAAVEDEMGCWLISARGKLLEKKALFSGCPVVTGLSAVEPEASAELSFGEEERTKCAMLLELLQEAQKRGLLENVDVISMEDDTCLQFHYLNRFTVKLPWSCDIAYKLDSLLAVVERLESEDHGMISMMVDGKVSFIP